jgi:hydrogenase expression/formation protein HypE
LDHGSGGEAARELVSEVILPRLDNPVLRAMDDSAVLNLAGGRFAMTTDSYVVDPIFFPGGNIGSLAVHGTVNDLSMQGADPCFLTLGLILEEGLPLEDLVQVLDAAGKAAREAGVSVVAGDTKVVPRGHADRLFINTAGIGPIPPGVDVSAGNARPGDAVLINGCIGDHGMAILSKREGLDFSVPILSDSAALNRLVTRLLSGRVPVHVLRDPTRGGVAAALNEIASASAAGIRLHEEALPVNPSVSSACEMLGLDPLYVANEGKCLVFVPAEGAEEVLGVLRKDPLGREARIIGEVVVDHPGRAVLRTRVGGTRILSTLTGEQLPRIC